MIHITFGLKGTLIKMAGKQWHTFLSIHGGGGGGGLQAYQSLKNGRFVCLVTLGGPFGSSSRA